MTNTIISLNSTLLLALGMLCPLAQVDQSADDAQAFRFDARAAEHLLNRAGFGAQPGDVAKLLEVGLEAAVEGLIEGALRQDMPFFAERLSLRDGMMAAERMAAKEEGMETSEFRLENEEMIKAARDEDAEQRDRFLTWWVDNMQAGTDPLGDRMTLFWHGWFTSSRRDVKSSFEMIEQNLLFQSHAVGRFGDLLLRIARDPAMLEYLDNDANRRKHPNENFARELMELFTLGEGQYSEADVKEAARAFTGWTDDHGSFEFSSRRHDYGSKTILGRTGKFDGDDVLEILLEQEACARFLAGGLIRYFEGLDPSEERLAQYAELLLSNEYELTLFLRTLFLDPEFYREAAVGTRIAGPIDFLVGSARRLGIAPPGRALYMGAGELGQRLFDPPNVRGWEGGTAWITTGTLMMRSNLMGGLLGLIDRGEESSGGERILKTLQRARWRPDLNFSSGLHRLHLTEDAAIANHMLDLLLAVSPTAEARTAVLGFLAREREKLGLSDGELLEARRDAEHVLRRLAHLILSLPEANLN